MNLMIFISINILKKINQEINNYLYSKLEFLAELTINEKNSLLYNFYNN